MEKQKQFLEKELNPTIEKAKKSEIELLFRNAAPFTLSAFLCMIWSAEHFTKLTRVKYKLYFI
jgi:hypothetical protein